MLARVKSILMNEMLSRDRKSIVSPCFMLCSHVHDVESEIHHLTILQTWFGRLSIGFVILHHDWLSQALFCPWLFVMWKYLAGAIMGDVFAQRVQEITLSKRRFVEEEEEVGGTCHHLQSFRDSSNNSRRRDWHCIYLGEKWVLHWYGSLPLAPGEYMNMQANFK